MTHVMTIHMIRNLFSTIEITSEEYRELSRILLSRQRVAGPIEPAQRFVFLEKIEWECPVNQQIYTTSKDYDTLDGIDVQCRGCGNSHKLVTQ